MRVVLYDHETCEPITVLDMYRWQQLRLPEGSPIKIPIYRPISRFVSDYANVAMKDEVVCTVTIYFEHFRRSTGQNFWMAFANDPENALLLRAAFLPGQRWTLNDIKREAFADGFVEALNAIFK